MKDLKILALLIAVFFILSPAVFAQEEELSPEVIEAVELDENIQPEDLGIGEPKILPDSPFYFLKEWGRNIQAFFTFNTTAKAELRAKFANEKLMEVKKMVEQNKNRERIEKAVQLYQQEIGEVERVTQKIREKAEESVEVGEFLDKFIQHQILHQRVLQKLEQEVPAQVFEKIKEAREEHLETFGQVMDRLQENKEELQERLEKNLEQIKGGEFKELKSLELLKELEEKLPEQAQEAVKKVQETELMNLKNKLEEVSTQTQENFQQYIEKVNGTKEKQIEILGSLKSELEEKPEIQKRIIQSRDKILEGVKQKEGEATQFCITLWDPVCGQDGKTYSNQCFAQLAGVEIAYKGECQKVNK